jgi:hypothetical protein
MFILSHALTVMHRGSLQPINDQDENLFFIINDLLRANPGGCS